MKMSVINPLPLPVKILSTWSYQHGLFYPDIYIFNETVLCFTVSQGEGPSSFTTLRGSKGLTATTITTTTTTFNTKHKINCKLTHDYASPMLSQFYKFSLSMLYTTSQLETTVLLAYVYLVFERLSKETFLAIGLNNKLYMAFRCYNKKCTMRGLL